MKQKTYRRGISLIVLVITIIIMIIIAAAIILSLNGSGVIQKGTSAVLKSDMKNIQAEYDNYVANKTLDSLGQFKVETLNADKTSLSYSGQPEGETGNVFNIIPSASGKYSDKIKIINGKLYYEYETAEEMNTINDMDGVSSVIKEDMLDIRDGVLMGFKEDADEELTAGTMIIPSTVTSIYSPGGYGALFATNKKIRGVVIQPNSITEIPNYTFVMCSAIEEVVIPEGFGTIGQGAFQGTGLKKVSIKNVNTIGNEAFKSCDSLETVDVKNVNTIGMEAFGYCDGLKTADIENVNILENGTFQGSSLETATIKGNGSTKVGTDYGIFALCSNLKTVYIENVAEICDYAFHGSGVETVTIKGNGSTKIGTDFSVFAQCSNLKTVTMENVGDICDYAFYTSSVETVTIIGNGSTKVGMTYGPFSSCSNLKTVYIENVNSVCDLAFHNSSVETVTIKGNGSTSIGECCFQSCSNLTQILLDGIGEIELCAFWGCDALNSAVIPATITNIGERIFERCPNIDPIQLRAASLNGVTTHAKWNYETVDGTEVPKEYVLGYAGD